MPEDAQRIARYQMLHGLLDECLALYLSERRPPRRSISDPLETMIERWNLREHAVDELLQAYFRSPAYRPNALIFDLMQWSYLQTLNERGEFTERCFICGKEKGQPPDRCPGHYIEPL